MRKRTKRFFTLLFSFILLMGIFVLIKNLPQLFKKEEKVFKGISKNSVKQIIITDDKERVTITKKNHRWVIKDFPADEERVEKIIESLLSLNKEEVISRNKSKYKEFEVEGKRKIEFEKNTIYVGKSYSYNKSYFRVNQDPNVYLADKDLSSLFYPNDFRDLKVYLIIDEAKVEKIEEEWEGKSLRLTKKNNQWHTLTNKTAKKERIDFFLNDIKTLKGDDLFEKRTIDLSAYQPELLLVVKEGEKEKKGFFYQKDREKYYFYQEGSNYVYQIPAAYVSSLKKEEKDLLD